MYLKIYYVPFNLYVFYFELLHTYFYVFQDTGGWFSFCVPSSSVLLSGLHKINYISFLFFSHARRIYQESLQSLENMKGFPGKTILLWIHFFKVTEN